MKYLRQSTATVIPFGPSLLPSDGVTLVTTLVSALDHATTGIFLCKNGAASAVRHATVTATTYDAYGSYLVTLDTTDTGTVGRLRVMFAAAASCLPIWEDFTVLSANVYDSFAAGSANLAVNATQFAGQTITAAAGVTLPSSVASPTNITAGTLTTVTTATNLTTNNDKTGYGLSASAVQAVWDALTSALTTVGSIGKLIVTNLDALISSRTKPADTQAAVTLVTTLTTYTGNTPQTGDAYARLGAAGAGLTALGDTRLANLDAAITTRTKPADTQAAVTTVTNLTNAPTAGDLTATMKTSVTTAATAATPVAASVTGAVGSVTAAVTVSGDLSATMKTSVATAVGSRIPTESYAVDGAAPTYDQFLYMLWAVVAQFAITGTTISTKKLDGTTEAMQFTIDDATTPTSRTRTT